MIELAFECPMPHLRAIHAAHNRIKTIPDALPITSAKLQSLRLNDNQITRMPNLDSLNGLIELDIRNNRMHKLPHTNPGLVTFEIDGNYASTTGPFLGNEHLKRGTSNYTWYYSLTNYCTFSDFKFNRKDESRNGGGVNQTTTPNSDYTKSTQIVKSDTTTTTSSLISDTTAQVSKGHWLDQPKNLNQAANRHVQKRRQALKNFVETQKENFRSDTTTHRAVVRHRRHVLHSRNIRY